MIDVEYEINAEFQQGALQLADTLDLDEIEAARIMFEARGDADVLGRPLLESSIIRFHQTRKYLLDCFRLMLYLSIDMNVEENIREVFQDVVRRVIQPLEASSNKCSQKFVQRCLKYMEDIRLQLLSLVDKLNGASVLGQTQKFDFLETVEYQRISLVQQHEALGIILHYVVKASYSTLDDFEHILDVLKRADKYDNLLGKHICFKHCLLIESLLLRTFVSTLYI